MSTWQIFYHNLQLSCTMDKGTAGQSMFGNSPFVPFMPPASFMQPQFENKGFWASWGPVLCAAMLTIVILLISYVYVFQNKQAQPLQQPAALQLPASQDVSPQQQQQQQPRYQPQQNASAQNDVIVSTTPIEQVQGFDQ